VVLILCPGDLGNSNNQRPTHFMKCLDCLKGPIYIPDTWVLAFAVQLMRDDKNEHNRG
jgi:hypothetical protein